MGNSPCPCPNETSYGDVNVSYTLIQDTTYKVRIENTGSLYASINHIHGRNGEYYTVIYGDYQDNLFRDEVVIPGKTKEYTINVKNAINNPEQYTWSTYALDVKDENVKVTNPKITKVNETLYEINANVTGRDDYYYGGIVEISYDGIEYAFEIDLDNDTTKFSTVRELDLTKLTIEKVTAYRSTYHTYKSPYSVLAVMIPLLILGGGIILLSLIAAAIVIPITVTRHRRKKNNAKSD